MLLVLIVIIILGDLQTLLPKQIELQSPLQTPDIMFYIIIKVFM